jgi:hypothetical protein
VVVPPPQETTASALVSPNWANRLQSCSTHARVFSRSPSFAGSTSVGTPVCGNDSTGLAVTTATRLAPISTMISASACRTPGPMWTE